MAAPPFSLLPGHGLGPLNLGASLLEILTIIKADNINFSRIDVHISNSRPVTTPVIVSLPDKGLRLQFDGADQQLRLIEVVDFTKVRLAYKGSELIKPYQGMPATSGPPFKRIYQIFGASYPGEYVAPENGSWTGRYVLSWSGIGFTFPFQHSAWSAEKDHVSLLGSAAAGAAVQMAVFEGSSWPEARKDLFVRTPTAPRLSASGNRSKDYLPAEIEFANVQGDGRIELVRRHPAPPFTIVLDETTPQDLITELGPPDTTHKRNAKAAPTSDPSAHRRTSSMSRPAPNGRPNPSSQPSSYSSTGTETFDADFDSGDAEEDAADRASRESFWCYFSHGVDVLVGPPSEESSASYTAGNTLASSAASPHLVVTKVVLHGNVPGSYAFNRHRRLRWTLSLPSAQYASDLTSEGHFERDLKPALLRAFKDTFPASEMSRGKVVNRTWSEDTSDSSFFLPDAGEDLVEGSGSEQWLGNTQLYTFPGLVWEVLENGAVSALTVY